MKYEIEANEDNIFESLVHAKISNDEYLNCLIKLLDKIDNNQIICIEGDWGSGKTFFIKQFEYLINNYDKVEEKGLNKIIENYKKELENISNNNIYIYYNAWENDDHEEPFDSLIYNILNIYPKYKDKVTTKFSIDELLKETIKFLTQLATKNLLGIEFSSDSISKIKSFDDLAEKINTKEEKKEIFKKLIDSILGDKRMILVIDELDRCNPNYAIRLLETIKHFYNMDNITTIVLINNKEMESIIKHQYGYGFDSHEYLNKFYDYVITIDSSRNIEYCQKCLNFSRDTYLPHYVFYAMAKRYNFSLRDCNRYKTLYETAKSYIENEKTSYIVGQKDARIIFCIIIPIILAFKIKDEDAYNECLIRNGNDIKEALYFVEEFFKEKDIKAWLENLTETTDKEEAKEEILSVFNNIFKNNYISNLFMKLIKTSI